MRPLLFGLGLFAAADARAIPAELDTSQARLRAAACLAGFELGPCEPPCVRVVAGQLEVVHSDARLEHLELDDPELAFTLAFSRLTLGPLLGPVAPSPRPTVAHSAPKPEAPDTPALPDAPESSEVLPAEEPVPVVPAPGRVARARVAQPVGAQPVERRPRGPTPWASGAVGAGAATGLQVAVETGLSHGPWLAGVGAWVDGAVVVGAGGGAVSPGRLHAAASLWVGAEHRPAECLVCQVDIQEGEDGTRVITTGPFGEVRGPSGWGPAGRVIAGVAYALHPRIALGPRLDATLTAREVRVVGALAVRWSLR